MSGSPCVSVGYLTAKLIKCLALLQNLSLLYLTIGFFSCKTLCIVCTYLYKLKVDGYNLDQFALCDVDLYKLKVYGYNPDKFA